MSLSNRALLLVAVVLLGILGCIPVLYYGPTSAQDAFAALTSTDHVLGLSRLLDEEYLYMVGDEGACSHVQLTKGYCDPAHIVVVRPKHACGEMDFCGSDFALAVMSSAATEARLASSVGWILRARALGMTVHVFLPNDPGDSYPAVLLDSLVVLNIPEPRGHLAATAKNASHLAIAYLANAYPQKKWIGKFDDDAYLYPENLIHEMNLRSAEARFRPTTSREFLAHLFEWESASMIVGKLLWGDHVSGGAGYVMTQRAVAEGIEGIESDSNSCWSNAIAEDTMWTLCISATNPKAEYVNLAGMYINTPEQADSGEFKESSLEGMSKHAISFHWIKDDAGKCMLESCRVVSSSDSRLKERKTKLRRPQAAEVAQHKKIESFAKDWGTCDFVYLDLGGNIGVQPRKFFEPELYPDAPILGYFDNVFGPVAARRERGCVVSFEANPSQFPSHLDPIERCYKAKGWRIVFLNYAVTNEDGGLIDIYSDTTSHHEDWAAGILPVANQFDIGSTDDKTNSLTHFKVPTIDIGRFLLEVIRPLRPEHVFMKMDIEGAEMLALPKMLEAGALCKEWLQSVILEFHPWAVNDVSPGFKENEMVASIRSQKLCEGTEIVDLDDESYLHDGMPLPCGR